MDGLRLFGECDAAAREYSKDEGVNVMIICRDGSGHLYIDGSERELPLWFAATEPVSAANSSFPELDFTPAQVQSGHWSDDLDRFVGSRTMTVEGFLEQAAASKRTR